MKSRQIRKPRFDADGRTIFSAFKIERDPVEADYIFETCSALKAYGFNFRFEYTVPYAIEVPSEMCDRDGNQLFRQRRGRFDVLLVEDGYAYAILEFKRNLIEDDDDFPVDQLAFYQQYGPPVFLSDGPNMVVEALDWSIRARKRFRNRKST